MSKQLNISLAFSADTSAAKRNLEELKKNLATLSTMSVGGNVSDDIKAASAAAKDLQIHLGNAMNVNTGNLDLTKFQRSLHQSGQSLTSLTGDLLKAGIVGEQTFLNISKSISNANINLNKTQGMLGEFVTTLKNTARWQLSSSLLHGFMGALQSSISYAQELDSSLNDIRIVSGLNNEAMAEFAEQANKSAKALSTTTNAYAQAALIFYQQGLDSDAVKERTDAVIKMSNVTKDSEEDVSSYMTAIWSNFAGEKEQLEEYADVIAALGAATASSSSEIAGGLEKFAAIGQQIGLSYDYATTALATVVAKTRQSEDVVGTAFKTIFARIQGLNLGETLDDGTDLNKYSKALMAVGINIKDTNGELKDMDTILNEMGARWQTLSRDEQTALAQTVAGVRQYNQLVALMDSWSTDFQDNLKVAQNSKGELTQQAAIYAESWDAAKDRVRASLESIYSDLIPEKTIINLTDGFAKVLNVIDLLIDSFGGLQGIVMMVSTIMVSKFQSNIAQAMDSGISKVQQLGSTLQNTFRLMNKSDINKSATTGFKTGDAQSMANAGQKQVDNYEQYGKSSVQKDYSASLDAALNSGPITAGFEKQIKSLQTIDSIQSKIAINSQNLTNEEKEKLEVYLKQVQALGDAEAKLADEIEKIKEEQELLINTDLSNMYNDIDSSESGEVSLAATDTMGTGADGVMKAKAEALELNKLLKDAGTILGQDSEIANKLTFAFQETNNSVRVTALSEESMLTMRQTGLDLVQNNAQINADISRILSSQGADINKKVESMNKVIDKAVKEKKLTEEQSKALRDGVKAYAETNGASKKLSMMMAKNTASASKFANALGSSQKTIAQAANNGKRLSSAMQEAQVASARTKDALAQVTSTLSTAAERALSFSGMFSTILSGATSVAMGISQISNAIDQIADPNVDWTQKLLSGVMAAGAGITALSTIMKSFQSIVAAVNAVEATSLVVKKAINTEAGIKTANDVKEIAMLALKVAWQEKGNDATEEEIAMSAAEKMSKLTNLGLDQKTALAKMLLIGAKNKNATASTLEATAEGFDTAAKGADTAATIALTMATYALTWPVLAVVAAIALLVAGLAVAVALINAQAKATEEQRKKAIEAGQAAKDQADANKALIDSYEKALKTYKETGEGKEELKEAALALAEAYDSEEMRVAALTGRYEDLTKAMQKARAEELEEVKQKTKAAKEAAAGNFEDDMRDGVGNFSGGKYNADFGNGTMTNQFGEGKDEYAIGKAFDELEKAGKIDALEKAGGDIELHTGQSSEDMISAYEEVLALMEEAEKYGTADELAKSEIYQNMSDWVAKSAESYEALKTAQENYKDVQVEDTILDTIMATGDQVDSLEEYRALVEKTTKALEDQGMSAEDAKKAVDSYMSMDANHAEFANAATVSDDLVNKIPGLTQDEADTYIESLNGDYSLLAQIDFDDVTSKEHFDAEMKRLQAVADTQEIQTKIGIADNAIDKLKKNMSMSDYAEFETESGLNWGEEGIIQYGEFLALTYEQQQQYLNDLKEKYQKDSVDSINDQMSANQVVIEQLKADLATALGPDGGVTSQEEADKKAEIEAQIAEVEAKNNELIQQRNLALKDVLTSAQSLNELEASYNQMLQDGQELNYDAYAQALVGLGEQYDNCTNEIEEYNEACLKGDEAQIKLAEGALKSSIMAGEAAKQYKLDADNIEVQAKQLAKAYDMDVESATRLAIANQRMNKGVATLNSNWNSWSKTLKKSDHTTMDYAEALQDATEALADLTGSLDAASIPADFLDSTTEDGAKHLDLLGKAAEGDVSAINQLGAALGEATVKAMEFNGELVADAVNSGVLDEAFDLTKFEEYRTEVLEGITSLQEQIKNGTLTAGQDITSLMDGTGASWVESLNQMAIATGMGVEEMNALLNQLGVQAKVNVTDVEQDMSVPTYTEVVEPDEGIDTNGDGEPDARGYHRYTIPGPSKTVKGTVQVAQISTEDGEIDEAPKIKYVGTGGSVGGGGVSPSSTTTSGSNKEAKKPDKKKAEDPEIDKYRTITEQLEKLEEELDNIGKAKDRAFGPAKLKLLQQEIAKQEEINNKKKEYLDMLEKDRDDKKSKLASMGAVFDEKGTITNYEELIKNNQPDYTEYNNKIEDYRKLSGNQQAALDEEYKNKQDADGNYYSGYEDYLAKTYADGADKAHEEFMDLLDGYVEADKEYSKTAQEILEGEWAKFDLKLEGIEYVVDIKLDVDDRDLKYLEFLLEELEDKDFSAAESIANIGAQVDTSLGKIDTYRQGINDILSEVGEGYTVDDLMSGNVSLEQLQQEGLSADGLAKLEEYIDGLGEENSKLRELRENAWAQVSDEFNEYIGKMDDGIEKIEHLKNITQSYKNIVDIVGKNFLGISNDLMDKMNAATVKQSKDTVEANKAKMEAIQASYDELLNQDTSGWSDQAKKKREEQLKEMEAELQGAKEAFMSSWEEALQASADRYAAAVDNIISEFEDKIAGLYGTLDELQEAYDRASDLDSQYLEDYEQIYQLSKLTRDINNSIDDTDNIAAKEQYKELLEEINEIEANGTKMSEYDLQVLQKKFELKQAQMALEEAQNAKSSVSMVRGEDGNFSYVYTASDEDVANAEQNYEDKLHEMQQLNGDYINDLQSKIIQTQAECADALAQIKESDFNSYEEWREAVDRTQAYYDEKMNFYYSQLDGALANNRDLYENDWQNYSDLTGYKISADENYVDKFGETNYAILTGFQSTEEAHSAWNTASQEMLLELSDAYATWQGEVEGIMGAAGTSVEGFANTMETETDRNVADSEKVKESVQETAQSMEEDFANTVAAIVNWEQVWGAKAQAAIDKNKELIESYNELKRAMADALGSEDGGSGGGGDSGNGGSGGSGSGGGSGGSGSGQNATDNSDKAAGVAAAIWMDGGATSGWYNGGDRRTRLNEKGVAAAQSYINAHGPNGDIYSQWHNKRDQLKNFYYGSFATGGYTGDWGDSSGRLAVLHSKEIVLNKDDTQNFLKAIDMVREMSHIIDLNAKYASAQYEAMMQPMVGRGGSPEIVQNIEINAEFPDATDHSEIEMAFNNLINTASQYANRVR